MALHTDPARVRELYDSSLRQRLAGLEGLRRQLKRTVVKAGLLVGGPFLVFFISDWIPGLSPAGSFAVAAGAMALVFVAIVVVAVRYFVPGLTAYVNYGARFKQEVLKEVVALVCPTAEYTPGSAIAVEVFDEAGIFSTRGAYLSDDRIRGTIGHTPFQAAEVRRRYVTSTGKHTHRHVVFHGFFIEIERRVPLTGTTIVQARDIRGTELGDRSGFQEVPLASPAFDSDFIVLGTDITEARSLVTPAVQNRLAELRRSAGRPIFVAFKKNRTYVAIHYGRPLFEPSVAETTSPEAIQEMASQLALAETIVADLEQDAGEGPPETAESILQQPDVPASRRLDIPGVGSRNVTASEVWAAAVTHSDGELPVRPTDPAPRPADARTTLERMPGELIVTFPRSAGFFIALILTGVSAAVCWNAARGLHEVMPLGDVTRWLGSLPATPWIGTHVTAHPVPWAAAALVVGSVSLLFWMLRVRRVVIARDAIRITRGFRPVPRTYSRPPYDRALHVERFVQISTAEAFLPLNPSASPVLSSIAEARWVASEMDRALRETR